MDQIFNSRSAAAGTSASDCDMIVLQPMGSYGFIAYIRGWRANTVIAEGRDKVVSAFSAVSSAAEGVAGSDIEEALNRGSFTIRGHTVAGFCSVNENVEVVFKSNTSNFVSSATYARSYCGSHQ